MVDLNMPAGMFRFVVCYAHKHASLSFEMAAFNAAQASNMSRIHLEQMVKDVNHWNLFSVTRK